MINPFLCLMLYDGEHPCTGSVSTLGGVYSPYSYVTIGVGACCFGSLVGTGAGVGRLLRTFALGDAVVLD